MRLLLFLMTFLALLGFSQASCQLTTRHKVNQYYAIIETGSEERVQDLLDSIWAVKPRTVENYSLLALLHRRAAIRESIDTAAFSSHRLLMSISHFRGKRADSTAQARYYNSVEVGLAAQMEQESQASVEEYAESFAGIVGDAVTAIKDVSYDAVVLLRKATPALEQRIHKLLDQGLKAVDQSMQELEKLVDSLDMEKSHEEE